ncbi:MAG: thymidine phosphorylase family protein [Candidatus Gracilibacteria bacterium]
MYYLKPKKIAIRVGNKYVALLNKETAHKLDLHPSDRIFLKNGKNEVTAILDIMENQELKEGQIGLYAETWEKLKITKGDRRISAAIADRPKSVIYIRSKLDGKELTAEEMDTIVKDIVAERLSDVEMTYFVSGCFTRGMSDAETVALTKSIVANGGRLQFKDKIVVDKHCIGGVPGNRSTMLAVPIMTSLGLRMPKTSSRAITSPAGTADTMEVFCKVTNSAEKLMKIAMKVGGFITWGGGVDIAAADDKLIKVRNPMSLDPQGMLLASILAKKHSVSATHVLIDIPYGPDVKVKNAKDAQPLKEKFEKIGAMLGMKVKVVLSDGSQPIGNGVGPVLEALDILKVLKMEPDAPQDLVTKTIWLCGVMLEMTGKAKEGKGAEMAREALVSGKAYKKMQEIIIAQGKNHTPLKVGKLTHDVVATKSGKITAINNKLISRYARLAGAPINVGAGLFIHKKISDTVKKGDALFTLYAENKERLANTLEYVDANAVYTIK